ncbi:hypothetical protein PG989_012103 [Apiospora arundinis]
MWQPAIEGRSRRVIRIHHKLVKSRQQLTQALKKRMREGEDFYFEMRNDFYIIQVYGPKDLHVETAEHSMLGSDSRLPRLETTKGDVIDCRL